MSEDPVAEAVAEGALGGDRDCVETTKKGKPCKGKVVVGSDPPKCSAHLKLTGRKPPNLEGESATALLKLLAGGNYIATACAVVGIPERTYQEWMAKGREGKEPFAEFKLKADEALAEGESALVEIVRTAATDEWRAAAWLLERGPGGWTKPASASTPRPPRRPDGEETESPTEDDSLPQAERDDPFAAMEADLAAIEAAESASAKS